MRFFRKKTPKCAAVIAAAGASSRMGGKDKIFADLCGKPVIFYALRAFDISPCVEEIVVVTRQELLEPIARLCDDHGFSKVKQILVGGADRTQSVLIGAEAVSKKYGLIAVHDGARPLVPQSVITKTVEKAAKTGAAAPAIPVTDTIKEAENGAVTATPERSKLFAVQTPQVFDADLLRAALTAAQQNGEAVTDDCAAAEKLGMRVFLTEGASENLKITHPMDLKIATLYLQEGGSLCESDTDTTSTASRKDES